MNLKKITFACLILCTILQGKPLEFSKEEKEFIDSNVVTVAMTPNLYPFNMLNHGKLEAISFDILQTLSKKSGLEFNYEIKDWFNNINPNLKYLNHKIPITLLSEEELNYNVLKNSSNVNIYFKDEENKINKFETIDYFTLNLSFDNFDLIISPLLRLQANILKNKTLKFDTLSKLRIDKIQKNDIQFGLNEKDSLLSSIIQKTFDNISPKEWEELSEQWEKYSEKKALSTLLNKKELDYIKNKNSLNICSVGNLAPIEFWDKNSVKGLSVDILNQINKNLNLDFLFIKSKSYSEALTFVKEKKCDLILNNEDNPQSKDITKETISIYTFDLAIITKKDMPVVVNLKSILNESIAIKKDSKFKEKIQNIYPQIKLVETKNDYESLKAISQGDVVFTLAPHIIASYYLSKYAINDLYISRYTNIPYKINMSVDLDNTILLNILNKSLLSISNEQKRVLLEKWVKQPLKEAFDYTFLLYISIFILITSSIIIYRQRLLEKYNKKLKLKVNEEIKKNKLKTLKLIEQSKLAQMGELINMIAHQWRQPLTSITSVTNNLLLKEYYDKQLTKEQQIEELNSIIDYAKYMSNTIDDFQNLYNKNKVKETTSFVDIIEKALNIINTTLEKENIKIKNIYLTKKQIDSYPRELNQVIINILKNSIDAFKRNKIDNSEIILTVYEKNTSVCLSIEDNAGGIKKENLDKIFNPYFSTKSKVEGTGLGLYMSKIIIENNCKGKLSVKNTNLGTRFIIEI